MFRELYDARVALEGIVLKPNMVIAGQKCPKQASAQQVAELTVKCLKATVPSAVPGIAFLSGGQSDEQATENLSLINADRRSALEGHLLLRPRAAGRRAQGLGRQDARTSPPASARSPTAPA